MNIANRTTAPERRVPRELPDLSVPVIRTANGTEIHLTEGGDQDLVNIAVEVSAGSAHQSKPAVASLCASMLTKGSAGFTADEIAEKTDFYGADIRASARKEVTVINLLTLNAHLEALLPVLADVIARPTFPEDELQILSDRSKNRLEIKLQHVRTRAARNFDAIVLGGTPFHTPVQPEDYHRVGNADLKAFHATHYRPENLRCFIAGKGVERAAHLLAAHLEFPSSPLPPPPADLRADAQYRAQHTCESDDAASQSAIFAGMPLVQAGHPDHPALYFLDKVLGGHFGSRLMRNLRVENGFTYGVRSHITQLKGLSYLTISTEVGKAHTRAALTEIQKELNRLTTESIPEEEMDLVRHQIAGRLSAALDGPFQRSSMLMSLMRRGLDGGHPSRLLNGITRLSAAELTEVAGRYFDPQKFSTAVVGECLNSESP